MDASTRGSVETPAASDILSEIAPGKSAQSQRKKAMKRHAGESRQNLKTWRGVRDLAARTKNDRETPASSNIAV